MTPSNPINTGHRHKQAGRWLSCALAVAGLFSLGITHWASRRKRTIRLSLLHRKPATRTERLTAGSSESSVSRLTGLRCRWWRAMEGAGAQPDPRWTDTENSRSNPVQGAIEWAVPHPLIRTSFIWLR